MSEPIEFDLGGAVGIRLIDAEPDDAAAVRRQLGPIEGPLSAEPDISIRFVDALPLEPPVRYLGLHDSAYTDDAFVVLKGRRKRISLPLDRVGGTCEIVCETGIGQVPFLIAVVNLTALAKGLIPVHASAFNYRGTGVLVTGWAKGGKTEALIPFVLAGAKYVGDEWVYLASDGSKMFGLPEPITIWDWHLSDYPELRAFTTTAGRARLLGLRLAQRTGDRVLAKLKPEHGLAKLLGKAVPLIERQRYVRIAPTRLFGSDAWAGASTVDKIIWVGSHESPEIEVRPADPIAIARRLVYSLEYERLPLRSLYLHYRLAFPDRRNEVLERAEEEQRRLLEQALGSKDSYEAYHPFPAPISRLFQALEPIVQL